jgi:hypothetical protein
MAASKKIKAQVIQHLFTSPSENCRTKKWLLKRERWKKKSLEKVLKELLKDKRIREERITGDTKYCLYRPIVGAPRLVYEYTIRTKKPLTTVELAKKVGLSSRKIYQACRSLEKRDYIIKGPPQKTRVFFAPVTGEIIGRSNYGRVQDMYKSLGKIVSDHDIGDPKLKKALQKHFQELRSRKDLTNFHKEITNYEAVLSRTVEKAKKKSEIRKQLGLKPFYSKINTWRT